MKTCLLALMFIFATMQSYGQQVQITVAKDGSGNYKTVQEAINAVPDNQEQRTIILVKNGVYKEKLILSADKNNVTIKGETLEKTVLTYDDYSSKKDSLGKGIGTTGSSSFFIYGAGFKAENITFENSSGPVGQAVALWVAGDKAIFINCRMLGFQDTLYTFGKGARQYYKNCYIEGTVDFIFGAATAIFEDCEIFCKKGGGYITAAATPDTTKYGYVFKNCRITGNAGPDTFYLGRPWRPFAKVVFINCNLGDMIRKEGWNNWGKEANEKTAFYAEYKSKGAGRSLADRVNWSHQLENKQAATYALKRVFAGWKPI